jgi:hypothetical protein
VPLGPLARTRRRALGAPELELGLQLGLVRAVDRVDP